MRHLALSDLSDSQLGAMLAEHETLFVEHKGGLRDTGFQVAKAVCSFANGLGGWVLIGVTKGRPNAGEAHGWQPVEPHELVDRVRQVLRDKNVDPIPAFAATVLPYGEPPVLVGVVRVYESTDTPHVMGNGQVFVRSVAEDSDAGRRYRPGGVETQAVLLSLAERGRAGAAAARRKLDPDHVPLAAVTVGVSGSRFATMAAGRVGVRGVPFNGAPFLDWAVSERAKTALERAARRLAHREDDIPLDRPSPHASGLTVTARSEGLLPPSDGSPYCGEASVTSDAAGVVAACLHFVAEDPPREGAISLDELRDQIVVPLLEAVASVLEAAEAHGRIRLELTIGELDGIVRLVDDGGSRKLPSRLPVSGEMTLPLDPERAELRAMADLWRSDVGRAAGYLTLRR